VGIGVAVGIVGAERREDGAVLVFLFRVVFGGRVGVVVVGDFGWLFA
jgi:hypothetical protein